MNSPITPIKSYIIPLLFSYGDVFDQRYSAKVDIPLNKDIKPNKKHLYLSQYIYIYIYIERERERDRQRQRDRDRRSLVTIIGTNEFSVHNVTYLQKEHQKGSN